MRSLFSCPSIREERGGFVETYTTCLDMRTGRIEKRKG